MFVKKEVLSFILLGVWLFSAACGVDGAVSDVLNPPVESKSPIARITTTETTVQQGQVVTLQGNASSDPQSSALTYLWELTEKPTGSASTLSSTTSAVISLTPDKGGYYTATLQVTNASSLASNVAALRVSVVKTGDNHPPVAVVGADQSVTAGDMAILTAAGSFDADGDGLEYSWALLSKPTDSTATISQNTSINSFLFTDIAGTYNIRLRVSDRIDFDDTFMKVTAN